MNLLISTLMGMGLALTGADVSGILARAVWKSPLETTCRLVWTAGAEASPACVRVGTPTACATARACATTTPCAVTAAWTPAARAVACATVGGVVADKANKGWLGVQLSPLPEPLAVQLELQDAGIMVINVAEGSPAAAAGLLQYDVLLEVNGENIPNDYAGFIEMMSTMRPGESVRFTLIRGGKTLPVDIVLGEWPKDRVTYQYDVEPSNVVKQELRGLGKIMRRDKDGSWIVEDLGDLGNLQALATTDMPGFQQFFHLMESATDDSGKCRISRTDEHGTIEIERNEPAGSITVRRTTEVAGTKSVDEKVYASTEELEAADPDAAKMLRNVRVYRSGDKTMQFVIPDASELDAAQKQWKGELERSLQGNQEAWQKLHEEMSRAYGEMSRAYGDAFGSGGAHAEAWPQWRAKWHAFSGPAQTRFDVDAEGRIIVTTRRGETEVRRTFRNEADLQARDAELYEQYAATLEGAAAE